VRVNRGLHADLPEVFEVRSDGYLYVLQDTPDEALHEKVREAADLCPTAAIMLED
jgi:ferredoxin